MMSTYRSYMFPLLSAVAGFLSVAAADITVKHVCPGDSVQAFQSIELNCSENIFLLKSNGKNADIEVWSIQNCSRNERLLPEYQGRLVFDRNGTITIQNFDNYDQANYVVISKTDPLPKIYEVKLSLIVAPTEACTPKIEKKGNSLIASVNGKDCGKPVATPYWKDTNGVNITDQPILNLYPGMEAKEYYACIKGVALTCVKNITADDYCTTFTDKGSKSPPASLETCNAESLIFLCIILGILLIVTILALSVIFIRYRRRIVTVNKKPKNPNILKKDTGKLDWEGSRTLLNDDQQMGLQTYCDNRKLQIDNPPSKLETQCDLENDREEARTELQSCNEVVWIEEHMLPGDATLHLTNDREEKTAPQSCNDPEKLKELIELRDEIRCKICTVKRMSVCLFPCRHIVTCTTCSRSLQKCPLCRVVIEDKLAVNFD